MLPTVSSARNRLAELMSQVIGLNFGLTTSGLAVAPVPDQDPVALFKRFVGGEVSDFEMTFGFRQRLPSQAEADIDRANSHFNSQRGVAAKKIPVDRIAWFQFRSSPLGLLIVRSDDGAAGSVRFGETGWNLAGGWTPSCLWKVDATDGELDFDAGRRFRDPLQPLHLREGDLRLAALGGTPSLAAKLALPVDGRRITWLGNRFTIHAVGRNETAITGELLTSNGFPMQAVFRWNDPDGLGGNQGRVEYSYDDARPLLPSAIRAEMTVNRSKPRPESVTFVKEFTDLRVEIPPRPWTEADFSPQPFIQANAASLTLRSRSNGVLYTVFRQGSWLNPPEIVRFGPPRRENAAWMASVRIVLVLAVLVPLILFLRWLWRERRKATL